MCIRCELPITEICKRKYHPECRADKNRIRVLEYSRTHKPTPGPKKPRKYKGTVSCKYCKTRVRRTGASQFTCLAHACRLACKRENKALHAHARRMLEKLHAKKDKAFHKKHHKSSESIRGKAPIIMGRIEDYRQQFRDEKTVARL